MKGDLIFLAVQVLGIVIFVFCFYRALLQAKKTIERDARIDNEEVPDGIYARKD